MSFFLFPHAFIIQVNKEKDSPVNLTNFTFKKQTIFEPPLEVVRNAGVSKRGPSDGSSPKIPTPKQTPTQTSKRISIPTSKRTPIPTFKATMKYTKPKSADILKKALSGIAKRKPVGINTTAVGIKKTTINSDVVKKLGGRLLKNGYQGFPRQLLPGTSLSQVPNTVSAPRLQVPKDFSALQKILEINSTVVSTTVSNVMPTPAPSIMPLSNSEAVQKEKRGKKRPRDSAWHPNDSSSDDDSDEEEAQNIQVINEGESIPEVGGDLTSALISSIVNPKPKPKEPDNSSSPVIGISGLNLFNEKSADGTKGNAGTKVRLVSSNSVTHLNK